jgi:apolipoprotein N-acyltransferase
MPAGSEPVTVPHTWRPLGVRIAAIVLFGLLAVVIAFAWLSFDPETRAAFTPFQVGTLVALALLAASLGHALARSRVVAETDRLVVINGYRRHEYEYAEVIEAHLPPGAPWVTLDLADGTAVSAMGIQGSDGARAQAALRELRAVLDAASAG